MALPLGQRLAQWRLPALLGLAATVVGVAWSGRPSFWWDEAATVSMADRSLRSICWQPLGHVDAVHGLYYVLIQGGFSVFGVSGNLCASCPSALAVGIATAVVGSAGADVRGVPDFWRYRSASLFMVLPRVTWAATEARSYAMGVGIVHGHRIAGARAVRCETSKRAWWILYGVVGSCLVATVLLYSAVLLLVPHAVIVVFGGSRVIRTLDSKRNRFKGFVLCRCFRVRGLCLCPR